MNSDYSRRKFIKKASLGFGAVTLGVTATLKDQKEIISQGRTRPEVWIGTVSGMGLSAENQPEMLQKILNIMEAMVPFEPDIICLPETFAYNNCKVDFHESAINGEVTDTILSPFKKFAQLHKCYLICPTYIRKNRSVYNAAILIDRKGDMIGEYLKAHPAEYEISQGIIPGPIDPPIFETDFGKIGIQICYDIKWIEGWSRLKQKGAEIIFWASAYSGGREICSKAWQNQVYVVSSTSKNTSRIIDISGEVIAQTGIWQPNYICAPVNLEKTFIPTWPYVNDFPKLIRKYNKKIKLTTFDEEEWTILESLDPELKIADIISEFGFKTQFKAIEDISRLQNEKR